MPVLIPVLIPVPVLVTAGPGSLCVAGSALCPLPGRTIRGLRSAVPASGAPAVPVVPSRCAGFLWNRHFRPAGLPMRHSVAPFAVPPIVPTSNRPVGGATVPAGYLSVLSPNWRWDQRWRCCCRESARPNLPDRPGPGSGPGFASGLGPHSAGRQSCRAVSRDALGGTQRGGRIERDTIKRRRWRFRQFWRRAQHFYAGFAGRNR
jgi:hypothetical protein